MTRFRNFLLLAIFLLATALPCAFFLTRIGIHAANRGSKSFLLRGGATEIGGIPKKPSDTSFKSLLDWHLTQNNPCKIFTLEGAARCKHLFVWNIPSLQSASAASYKLSSDMLAKAFYLPPMVAEETALQLTKNVAALALSPGNILYVIPPLRVAEDNRLAYNVFDFTDSFLNNVKRHLEQTDIQVLDLRTAPVLVGKPSSKIYFSTDHHMRGWTGHEIAQIEAETLCDRFNLSIDTSLLSDENFSCQIFPSCFLGSHGRVLSRIPCPPDDFDLISYVHPLDLECLVVGKNKDITYKSGDASILLDTQFFRAPLYRGWRYSAYLGGDNPFTEIHNRSCTNNISLLLIGDSLDNCVIPQLVPAVSRIVSIDPRHCNGLFAGALRPGLPQELALPFRQYIDSQSFDAVLVQAINDDLTTPINKLLAKTPTALAPSPGTPPRP